ncbi:sigma-70 family RNA polymerase sigma factor [Bacillus sp. 165]|uniref:sigma-70 family RNA polymerase sigma factor n=1 Tax=Bacillus sp. 165 TaxID=1529117 RepID=UPI001ADA8EBE|nr:sigma-70 family RNA polymerase sigma factor [Bacillus sp. 165]
MKPDTFEKTVVLYENMIKNQIKQLSIYRDYEDFYQCGLIGLWKAYEKFEEEKGCFSAYALHTVRGYLLGRLRSECRFERKHTFLDSEITEMIPDESVCEKKEDIEQYLKELNDLQKYVFLQRFYYGKSLTDIAKEQDMTYDKVRYLYREGLRKLKKRYIHV